MSRAIIAIAGASHAGKSSLCREIANYAYRKEVFGQIIESYGYKILQKFIKKGHTLLQVQDYQAIFNGQAEIEEQALKQAKGLVLLENPLFSCYIWCFNNAVYHGVYKPQDHREIFSQMSKRAVAMADNYDFVFYLPVVEQSLAQRAKELRKYLNFKQISRNDQLLYSYAIQTGIANKNWYKIDPYDKEGNRENLFLRVKEILEESCPILSLSQKEEQMFEQMFAEKPKRAGN